MQAGEHKAAEPLAASQAGRRRPRETPAGTTVLQVHARAVLLSHNGSSSDTSAAMHNANHPLLH